jgi:hypothetical protein
MDTLATLSDLEYQRRAWVNRLGFKAGQWDDFDYHIHILYDDTSVLPDPEGSLGTVLVSGDEIGRIRAVGEVLQEMLDRHGDATSEVFLSDPQWPSLVKAAGVALAAMVRAWGFRMEPELAD